MRAVFHQRQRFAGPVPKRQPQRERLGGGGVPTRELAALTQLLGRMREVMEDHEQVLAGDVMGLAVELSQQIMRHALQVNPEVVLPVVREAIASLPQGSQHPRLILHPQDAALVRSVLDVNQITPAPWRIVEDARLERGGCRIETATSELDASIGSRWKATVHSASLQASFSAPRARYEPPLVFFIAWTPKAETQALTRSIVGGAARRSTQPWLSPCASSQARTFFTVPQVGMP